MKLYYIRQNIKGEIRGWGEYKKNKVTSTKPISNKNEFHHRNQRKISIPNVFHIIPIDRVNQDFKISRELFLNNPEDVSYNVLRTPLKKIPKFANLNCFCSVTISF